MPKISVIVPVYNVEPYLRRCIDSILTQTYPDFELILVDDESPDACPVICDEYAQSDKRVRVIHQKNAGVSAARNSGLDAALGEYIAFCDSDDWWDRDFLEQHISCAEQTGADLIMSSYRTISPDGNIQRIWRNTPYSLYLESAEKKLQYLCDYIWNQKCSWEIWIRVFRRSVIERNHIRFCTTCGNYAEDLGFSLSYILYATYIKCIDYRGYNYFLRPESMMRSSVEQIKLNQLNEVSKSIFQHVKLQETTIIHHFPILHCRMMITEYLKLIGTPKYRNLPKYIASIADLGYFKRQTKMLFCNYSGLKKYYGVRTARQMLLLSSFCLHGNWNRFSVESVIAYHLLIKGD